MWKLALSTIHADDTVSSAEKNWFEEKIKSLEQNKILAFTDEQVKTLSETIHAPVENFIDEFKKIKDPANAAFLIHILHIVSRLDNHLHQKEQAIYNELEEIILGNVDMEQTKSLVARLETEQYHDDEFFKVDNEHSLFEKVIKTVLKLMSSGEYNFPDE